MNCENTIPNVILEKYEGLIQRFPRVLFILGAIRVICRCGVALLSLRFTTKSFVELKILRLYLVHRVLSMMLIPYIVYLISRQFIGQSIKLQEISVFRR